MPCRFAANLLVVHCRIYLSPTIIAVVDATFLNFIAIIVGIVAHIADVIVAMPPLNPRLNLGQFWDEMIRGMEERVASWLRLRLSQRSRLTIAKTLLVSIPVYAIQHLELNKRNQERIERVQQKLIWGGTRSRLSVAHTRLRQDQGGLAAYGMDAAREAWSIAWVARMERRPELPWVQIAIPLMRDTRSTGTHMNKVRTPWKQVMNVTRQNVSKAPSLRHIWEPWWKAMDYPGTFDPEKTLHFRHPATIGDLLIHPTLQPRGDLGVRAPERNAGKKAIETLLKGIPEHWMTLINEAREDGERR